MFLLFPSKEVQSRTQKHKNTKNTHTYTPTHTHTHILRIRRDLRGNDEVPQVSSMHNVTTVGGFSPETYDSVLTSGFSCDLGRCISARNGQPCLLPPGGETPNLRMQQLGVGGDRMQSAKRCSGYTVYLDSDGMHRVTQTTPSGRAQRVSPSAHVTSLRFVPGAKCGRDHHFVHVRLG